MSHRTVGLGILAVLLASGVWACSSDSSGTGGGGGGGGSIQSVCGLTCTGTATCASNGGTQTGTATVQGGACVIAASGASAKLSCDGTGAFTDPSGTSSGTWTGQGTSLSMTDPGGNVWNCVITPPPSGAGGSGGSGAGTGGTGIGGGDTGGGGTGGSSGDACESCAASSCATEYNACMATTSPCAAAATCMSGCSDQQCITDCQTQYADGYNQLMALSGCLQTNCSSVCN